MSLASTSDRKLAAIIGALLFVLVAWPIPLLHIPPYQDLPGHLAAVSILAHPDRYPEFLPTGFLKPNSFFFLWTLFLGKQIGFLAAAKLLVLLVLGGMAFARPRFVLHFTDRQRLVFAAPLLVPMVHNWFVSMGMLNFAASIPVTLLLLVELDRGRKGPAALLGILSWYLHPFPVVVVGLMCGAAILEEIVRERRLVFGRARDLMLPLLPAALAAGFVLTRHVATAAPKMDSPVYSQLQWALYNLWAHWTYGFTELTAITIVPAIALAGLAIWRFRLRVGERGVLGPTAFAVLFAAYLFMPYVAFDANYITPRFVPFLWAFALVRVPSFAELPLGEKIGTRRLVSLVMAVSAAAYIAGMPVDLFRLSRELDDFAAGTSVIPEGARLFPLNFNARPTSKNTFSLGTAWGLYVIDRHTSAIDAWANVPSMPIMLREPLPAHLEPMMRLRFIKNAKSREGFCAARHSDGFLAGDCDAQWRDEWKHFWEQGLPGFDFILLWDPPAEVLATIPAEFRESLVRGRLRVYERRQKP